MKNIFTEHPNEVGETYFEHFKCAQKYAWTFAGLFFMAFIHSIFPWIYNGTVSDKIKEIHDHIFNRLN